MRTIKLFVTIVLIVSIVGGGIYWQSSKEPGIPKPSPSVSEKPTETTKPSPEPTTSTPKPEPSPTTPSPEPTTPEVNAYTVEFDSNITATIDGKAIVSGDKVKSGSTILFTAKSVEHKIFNKFYNGTIVFYHGNPYLYSVTADLSVTAEYRVIEYKISLDSNVTATIDGKAFTGGIVDYGTELTLTAKDIPGKKVRNFQLSHSVYGYLTEKDVKPLNNSNYCIIKADAPWHVIPQYESVAKINFEKNIFVKVDGKDITSGDSVPVGTKLTVTSTFGTGMGFIDYYDSVTNEVLSTTINWSIVVTKDLSIARHTSFSGVFD